MNAILSQEEIDRLAGSISDSIAEEPSPNGKSVLSEEEINRITSSLGIDSDEEAPADSGEPEAAMPAVLSQEEIDRLASPEPAEPAGGGMLSQEEIDRLASMDSEPEPPASGGMLSQEEIDRLAAMDSEPEPPASGGMLSQEEIDRLAAMDNEPEEPASGGGMLSQEEIDRLASMDSEPEPASGGGMLSQEEIDRLSSMDSEPEEPASGGGMLSQEEIDRLAAIDSEPAPPSGGGMLSQEEIDKLSGVDSSSEEAPVSTESVAAANGASAPLEEPSMDEGISSVNGNTGADESVNGDQVEADVVSEEAVSVESSGEEEQKSRFDFILNSKMAIIVGVPLVVISALTFLIIKIFFSGPDAPAKPLEKGFSRQPAQVQKTGVQTSDLQKGVNLFVDSLVRDGIEATAEKSKELFYAYKLQGTEETLMKSFAFDLSASLIIAERNAAVPERFMTSSMRQRFVPAIKKMGASDDLGAETTMLDWGRSVIRDLKVKKPKVRTDAE